MRQDDNHISQWQWKASERNPENRTEKPYNNCETLRPMYWGKLCYNVTWGCCKSLVSIKKIRWQRRVLIICLRYPCCGRVVLAEEYPYPYPILYVMKSPEPKAARISKSLMTLQSAARTTYVTHSTTAAAQILQHKSWWRDERDPTKRESFQLKKLWAEE